MKTFIKYFLTFLFGFFVALGGLFIVILIAVSSIDYEQESPEIAEKSILKIELPTELSELSNEDPARELLAQISGNTLNLGLNQLKDAIKSAASNPKIKGIYLDAGSYYGGISHSQEIRNALLEFKKSKKWILAYSENYSEQGYFIATAADKVYLNPKGMLEFDGFSSEIVFFKGLMEKLGVEFQVFKVGKFKGAVEPYTADKLSDSNRAQIQQYLNDLYQYQIQQISQSRIAAHKQLDVNFLNKISNEGLAFLPKQAETIGLVDALKYADEVDSEIQSKVPGNTLVSLKKYLKIESEYSYSENRIAVLYADGEIVSGDGEVGQIGSTNFIKEIRKIKEDKNIKAVVLRVNSPGGSSFASDVIAREIELLKKVKPVVVSFSNVAASGGYYIACLGDSIFAQPNSITGSIGVFALIPNVQNMYTNKLGLKYETVQTGNESNLWRPDQPLNPSQSQKIQSSIDQVYDDFISIVSKGRKLPKDSVHAIAQGRVYSGIRAKEIGLIDDFGDLDRAVRSASKMAKVKEYRIDNYPQQKPLFEEWLNEEMGVENSMNEYLNHLGIDKLTIKELRSIKSNQGMQCRMPWSIEIH